MLVEKSSIYPLLPSDFPVGRNDFVFVCLNRGDGVERRKMRFGLLNFFRWDEFEKIKTKQLCGCFGESFAVGLIDKDERAI